MDDLNSHTRKTGNVFMCELLVHVVRSCSLTILKYAVI